MEKEPKPKVILRKLRLDDTEKIRRMHGEIWRATYENEEVGVTKEWLEEETARWLTPESLQHSYEHFAAIIDHPEENFYRVVDVAGEPKGFIHATCKDGRYNLAGLYLLPELQGIGVATQLMEAVDEWVGGNEIDLEVVTYNTRAIRFYEKHGFVIQNQENRLFKGKLPNRTMVRKAKGEQS